MTEMLFIVLVRICIIVLAIGLVSLLVIGAGAGCVPGAVEVRGSDNVACTLEGYGGPHFVGYTELPIEGGECKCTGIPVTLICEPIGSTQ